MKGGGFVTSNAERKSRLMKWLSKLFKGGSTRGGNPAPQFIGDESMVLRAPVTSLDNRSRSDKENEELDRAIALFMAEGLNKPNGYGWPPSNDEDLAKSLQDDYHPPYVPNNEYNPIGYKVCGGCNRDIGYSNYLGCMGAFFIQSASDVVLVVTRSRNMSSLSQGKKHTISPALKTCIIHNDTMFIILLLQIQKRPKIGGHRLVGMRTQHLKLTRRCEVTAILVLYGLPRLLTGAILAHELMHGWLRLNGFRNLNPEVEEGICQVLSHMWLEAEIMPGLNNMASTSSSTTSLSKKGGKSRVENKLGKFFMHQIVNDASPAYGGGFRAANAAVNTYGLCRTLDHIRLTGEKGC